MKNNKAAFRAATKAAVEANGDIFDAAQFERAYAKARRWMVAAYGCADLDNYAAESGNDLSVYYYEVAAANKSINRAVMVP